MINKLQSQIYSEGTAVSSNIISLDIMTAVNRIPYARVVIGQGTAASQSPVELSDTACFQPGKQIEISLSNPSGKLSFKGIVIKQQLKKTGDNTYLTVDIKDSAHTLSLLRQSAVFVNKEDKEIIAELLKGTGLSMECGPTTVKHQQMVQYYCTKWDFIISRAEANGLLVCVENGKLIFKKPDLAKATVELNSIYEYEFEADFSGRYDEVDATCWDIKESKPVKAVNTNGSLSLEGMHDFKALAAAMHTPKCVLVSGIGGEAAEMQAWANAGLLKNRFALIQGRISLEGNCRYHLGSMITLSQAGEIFGATAIIAGIRHRIDQDGWVTDLQCGLSSNWFYRNDDLVEKPAAGLLPGINGLQIGVVQAYPADGDPGKIYRVKVRIPAFDAIDSGESVVWARLNLPYAGDQRGMFWVPEAGDEVVVGFFNDDPRHAVVLGSLYNGQTEPPLQFSEANQEKGIITKNGIKIVFTDAEDKEKLTIATPGGNTVLLEDENGIAVEDKNKNKITLHDKGVSFEDKNRNKITTDDKGAVIEDTNKNQLTLSKQGVELKDANGNTLTLNSAGIELKDMNGNKAVLAASGITVQSAANVTVKGAVINLN
jgi:Rhs element Vgr protein